MHYKASFMASIKVVIDIIILMQAWMAGARRTAGKEIAHLISVPAQLAIFYKISPVLDK